MAGPVKDISQAGAGHLKDGGLNLKQTEKVRARLSKKATARYSLRRLEPVSIEWRKKS